MKLLLKILPLILLLNACAPAMSPMPATDSYPNPSYPNPSYPNPSSPNDTPSTPLTPAEEAAVALLAQTLNLPPDQITLVSAEAVLWPDGCLGVQRPGMMCTQAVVEGYRIVLAAGGKEYEVHTNQNGSAAVLATESSAASLIEGMLLRQLAENLALDESKITVVSSEAVEFPDACLGVAMPQVTCAQQTVAGRIIVLEADGVQYEYHVSQDGRQIQPATLALTWVREGGFAGFCDHLTVFQSGEVYGGSCKSGTADSMKPLAALLSPLEIEQFQAWLNEYGVVTLDASDPAGVADGMTVRLVLYGRGTAQPLKNANIALFEWAQTLYQTLNE